MCVCVRARERAREIYTYSCLHSVPVCMSVWVWVKDEGKGDRTGLSDAAEIRKTYDRLQGWYGGVS